MSDNNLRDDMLKLVQYKIIFVKRDYEHVLQEQEELIADNIDAAGYTMWKIAIFMQQLCEQRQTPVPTKWKRYPPNDPQYREGDTRLSASLRRIRNTYGCTTKCWTAGRVRPTNLKRSRLVSSLRFVTTCNRVSDSERQGSASHSLRDR